MFATPDEVEAAYYQAFAQADYELMRRVWLDSEHVSCIHPLAEQIAGHRLVMAAWRAIFEGQGPMPIEFSLFEKHLGGPLAVHIGVEHLHQENSVNTLTTTNVYQLDHDGWHMLSHHASPQPAAGVSDEDTLH